MLRLTRAQRGFGICNVAFMIAAMLVCLLPLVNVIAVSLSTQGAVASGAVTFWPVGATTIAYRTILREKNFLTAFYTSVKRVAIGVPLNMLLSIMAAYPLCKEKGRLMFRQGYVWYFIITMLVSGGLIPTYLTMRAYGLRNSFWALVLPSAMQVYNTILLLNFFKGIPQELEEAARIDGAGHWRILWGVYVPCSLPAIATVMLFCIVFHWNEWFSAQIYMNRTESYPLQSYLQTLLNMTKNLQNLSPKEQEEMAKINTRTFNAAQIVISTIPVLVVYPFLQRYFVTGLTLGGVKG
jgi:putative aldouronate transport system permease protein